jgi:hypothetical protein
VTGHRLTIAADLFREILAELARRGAGRRESGAFLLADRGHPAGDLPQPVTAVAYYDDLDPDCLTGNITFHARGYAALNARCRRDGLRVVADVHTHPGQRVEQSRIEAAHPMVALDGHVALIVPRYAADVLDVAELGVHVRVGRRWNSFYGQQATEILQVRSDRSVLTHRRWWNRVISLFDRVKLWRRPVRIR